MLYFFPIDVLKTTPQACDFTVPVWSPSRAKVACGHQKDKWSQIKILSAKKKKPGSPTCLVQWVCQKMLEFSSLASSPIIYHHFRPWHPFVPFTGLVGRVDCSGRQRILMRKESGTKGPCDFRFVLRTPTLRAGSQFKNADFRLKSSVPRGKTGGGLQR